jgi:hypothetical protein
LSRPLLERRGNYEHKTHTQTNFFENSLVAESVDHRWLQQAANGRKSYVDQKIKEWVLTDTKISMRKYSESFIPYEDKSGYLLLPLISCFAALLPQTCKRKQNTCKPISNVKQPTAKNSSKKFLHVNNVKKMLMIAK